MNFSRLHPFRFEIFFFSQFLILFGSIFVTEGLFESILLPLAFIINISAGLILMSKQRVKFIGFLGVILISVLLFLYKIFSGKYDDEITFIRMVINFVFYVFVTYEIVKQVWDSERISANIIFGLVSGYVSIGLIGYFLCMTIELVSPGSFQSSQSDFFIRENFNDTFMYFSYITLLSIGYGDISPVTALAQKVVVLVGLIGQMYNVIITAIIVGKYLNQISNKKK
ncbi:ion channel [Flavicella marina]|uniref:ion channel n=1 Tax=Flavicella marina TaxID=1475951 RepID=UPI0012652D43|nr:ion channel [Flavicella marina]